MNKYLITAVAAALISFGALAEETQERQVVVNPPEGTARVFNAAPTGGYGASRVEAKLNINIKDDTKSVHFVRDNSDPYIVTKAYLIKNADVYNLRGVLKTIVSGSLVVSPVSVDPIMYNDGVGVLLVSAEEYRFKDVGNGMSMDEVVASLDRKDLANSYGTIDMAYFPKYNTAKVLLKMMKESEIGFTQGTATDRAKVLDDFNLSTNADLLSYAMTDDNMNVIVMTAAGFDIKQALQFLQDVDTPAEEIKLTYKLVEVYAENDQKLGLDFQAWKNNDGIDLFSAGGKYGTNWSDGLMTPNNGYRYAEFYNFNPKWNTKYLDFLTVCGKAKVVSSGSIILANYGVTNLTLSDGLFSIAAHEIKNEVTTHEITPVANATTMDGDGNITKSTTASSISQVTSAIAYTLEDMLPSDSANKYYASRKREIPVEALNMTVRSGRTQDVEVTDGNLFQMSIGGTVHAKASDLEIAMASTSIIGWDGEGKARLTKSSYRTSIQINSEKKEFVIGGLTKSSVVRSVTGLPFLKDIPGLGWLFSTETDTVKKSQFVLIATAEMVKASDSMTKEEQDAVKAVDDKVNKSVQNPMGTLGFQQLLLDDKIQLDSKSEEKDGKSAEKDSTSAEKDSTPAKEAAK